MLSMAEILVRDNPSPQTPSPRNPPQMKFAQALAAESLRDVAGEKDGGGGQLSVLAVLVTIFRKSMVACRAEREKLAAVEIGWPTDVRHVAHVTFDRFNGFLGLPVEFEPEVPSKPPSASTSVFGVSTSSMQLSHDSKGNSVPTILLLMQQRMYSLGGLQAEGIFRINAENTQEEFVRAQLNAGVVAEGVDVHCLAGLIKAWFRELPTGILDSLSPEEVMQCQTEEECAELVKLLPPTEGDLLDWAVNLMADVVENESFNKMNVRNVAMVFSPNMTQMGDPFTALMYAVHVMNFLKSLVTKTLREREQFTATRVSGFHLESRDEIKHQSRLIQCEINGIIESGEIERALSDEETLNEIFYDAEQNDDTVNEEARRHVYSNEKLCLDHYTPHDGVETGEVGSSCRCRNNLTGNSNATNGKANFNELTLGAADRHVGMINLSRNESRLERT